MKSMTGFAAFDGSDAGTVWRWELRSVNARGLDLKLRLPAGFEALDVVLRPLARAALSRGSVNVSLSIVREQEATFGRPEPEAIRAVIDVLREARETAADAGLPLAPVTAENLVPLLLSASSSTGPRQMDREALTKPLTAGFVTALSALTQSRSEEGDRLGRVIAGHLTQIESLVRDAGEGASEAVRVLRERTMRQVSEMMGDADRLDPVRLEQEIAILATKADVAEEIDRLRSHVIAARDLLAEDGPVGRKLDFLTQEFNREANTLCSKSSTEAMTRIGLELKTVIDQLREQAANVE